MCAAYLFASLVVEYHLVLNFPRHDACCFLGRLLYFLVAERCSVMSSQPQQLLTFGVHARLWAWFASMRRPSFCDPYRASCNCQSPYHVVTNPLEEN